MEIATHPEVVTPRTRFDRCRTALFALAASAVLSLTFATAAAAAPIVITFDPGDPIGGLPVGATLADQYAAVGVTFSQVGFSGPGGPNGNWAVNTDMTIVSSSGDVGLLGAPSLVSGNVLHSFTGWLDENGGTLGSVGDPSFSATFSGSGVYSFSADFAGIASPGSTRLFAYNGTTLLGTVVATATTGQETLAFSSATPITSVVITPGDFFDWVGVDNITFDPVAIVPEPTSMVLVGAGLAAAIARRRRR